MIEAIAHSNVGNVRSSHEDNYLLGFGQYIDKNMQSQMINNYYTSTHTFIGDEGIFAVCDGMGGHLSGEIASFETVKWLNNNYKQLLLADETLVTYIHELNRYVCNYSQTHSNCSNMGTTLSAIIATKQDLFFVNAGDSRIYEFRNNTLTQVSVDHTEGQRLLDLNLLTPREYKEFPSRKSLYKYIGRSGDLVADIMKAKIMPNTYYMICSDGVTDIVSEEYLKDIFNGNDCIDEIGSKIIKYALSQDDACTDNITVIILKTS